MKKTQIRENGHVDRRRTFGQNPRPLLCNVDPGVEFFES